MRQLDVHHQRPPWLPAGEAAPRGRRPVRIYRRHTSRGQSMVIFALSLTVLIALVGLAIDVVRLYDTYARMQRAAEAGALAGVIYMPNYYSSGAPAPADGNSAVSRALQETLKNGFGATTMAAINGCANPSTTLVAVCQVPGKPSNLRVTITQAVSVVLLGVVGAGPATISASAQAEYLPLVQMGSRSNFFGDMTECSPGGSVNTNTSVCDIGDTSANHLQYFMATMNGPAELKESGDPMVYCAEGPSDINGADPTTTAPAYNGYPTNHRGWPDAATGPLTQYCGTPNPGSVHGNDDYQPDGYSGPATAGTNRPGGYNYQVYVGPNVSSASLWVYNPNYVPTDTPWNVSPSNPPPPDRFIDAGSGAPGFYQGPLGEGIGSRFDGVHYDAPLFYFTTTYSLYSVNSLYDRSQDQLVFSQAFKPYDAIAADLSLHGCNPATEVYDPYVDKGATANWYHNRSQIQYRRGCVPPPPCNLNWCKLALPTTLGPGIYRLVVEATGLPANASPDYNSTINDGYGQHAYSLKICDSNAITTPISCSNGGAGNSNGAGQFNAPGVGIYGWNNVDVTFQATLSTSTPNKNYPYTACVNSANTPYACMDVVCLTPEYAGRSLSLQIYDPGDGYGNGRLYMGIVPPDPTTATVTYPSYVSTTTVDGDKVALLKNGSYRPLNGLWLNVVITLSPKYNGNCGPSGTGWFQMVYASDTGTNPSDKIAIKSTLIGSPQHLVLVD